MMTNRQNAENTDPHSRGGLKILDGPDWARFWPLVLPFLLYLPGIMGKIPFPSQTAQYTDLLISHYPNGLYLKHALQTYRQVPLWSPTILSGYPFAANPLAGLWYLPGWLALLFRLPEGFFIVLALHAAWGGLGSYGLLRKEGAGHGAAMFGAVAFMVMPKASAHLGAGHITLLYALAWTPWLLSAVRHEQRIVLSGLCLGVITLADPRWAAYSGGLWAVYYIAHSHDKGIRKVLGLLQATVLAGLFAAPLVLPMAQYARLSTRWQMGADQVFAASLNPAEFVGLFFPSGGRSPESAMYLGGAVLALVVLGIFHRAVRKRGRFYLAAALVSALYALGKNLPGMRYLASIPGLNLLRVPPRALFIFSFSAILVAALTAQEIDQGQLNKGKMRRILVASGFFSLLLLGGLGFSQHTFPGSVMWGMGAISVGVLFLFLAEWLAVRHLFIPLIIGLTALDGGGASWINIDYRDPVVLQEEEYMSSLPAADSQYGEYRIYSPSYSVPQHIAVQHQIELADGVDPLQLRSYVAFMEQATGVPTTGYSVTLPPFGEAPTQANRSYSPDPAILGLLNVRYLISDFPLDGDGLQQAAPFSERYIYRNQYAYPRAWVETADGSTSSRNIKGKGPGKGIAPADRLVWRPNSISIKAAGPGTMVLSEIAYPGWEVKVDGQRSSWQTAYRVLRSVDLPEGDHEIEFIYRPKLVYVGMFLFVIGVTISLRGKKQ